MHEEMLAQRTRTAWRLHLTVDVPHHPQVLQVRVEEGRAGEAGAQQRGDDVAHGAVVREADPLGRLHENATTEAGAGRRGHLARDRGGGNSVSGSEGSPGPGFHLQGQTSAQAESRSARGEPETHLRLSANTRQDT